jgi:Amt family ammonium transporter
MRISCRKLVVVVGLWFGLQTTAFAQAPAKSLTPTPSPAASQPVAAAAATTPPAAAPAPTLSTAPEPKLAANTPPAPITPPGLVNQDTLNGADTAWMLTSTALVLLMTLPGVALFYAGMVRRKSVLNAMACVVAICALVSLLWFTTDYSWAFTPGNGFIGGAERMWFSGFDYAKEAGKVAVSHIAPNVPESVYAMFQLTFAIITAALVVGSFVERMRFSAVLCFTGMWTLLVYAPIAHWV